MQLHIRKAQHSDIDGLAKLYDTTNDYLAANTNYSGWKKGVYPTGLLSTRTICARALAAPRCNLQRGWQAKQSIRSIRLDVYQNNSVAIKAYEKQGYRFIDKVDIGLSQYGLDLFCLYEKVLAPPAGCT